MSVTSDFRDILFLLGKHQARYLIIGGYAFAFHARPRYTKDLDILVDSAPGNVARVNAALADFGSPYMLDADMPSDILQLGVEPNRIDLLRQIGDLDFAAAWKGRVEAPYGDIEANWIGLDGLIQSKKIAGRPRDLEDVEALEQLRRRR